MTSRETNGRGFHPPGETPLAIGLPLTSSLPRGILAGMKRDWSADLPEVAAALDAILAVAKKAPLEGIDLIRELAPVNSVAVVTLSDDDKVRRVGPRLLVEPVYFESVIAGMGSEREKLERIALYFAHELAHIAQGIDKKTRVVMMRRAGGESQLADADLQADAFAVAATSAALGSDPASLWDLAGLAVSEFGISAHHARGARARKTLRLAGARMTFLAARATSLQVPPGFLRPQFHMQGGEVCVFYRGRVVGEGHFSRRDVEILRAPLLCKKNDQRRGLLEACDDTLRNRVHLAIC